MKKIVSLCLAATCFCMSQAQPSMSSSWTGTLNAVVEKYSDVYRTAPVTLTSKGAVYMTGKFNQTIASSKFFLEPIAQSSYLAKYDKDGAEQWAVALRGTATITSITTDTDENVYIAGVLADQVIFDSMSGEGVTLSGMEDGWGGYTTSQVTSFIAKYNAEGVLQTAKSLVPNQHPEIPNLTNDEFGPWYFGEPEFTINHLEWHDGQLYASALYSGSTEFEGVTFTGRLINNMDFMMVDNLKSATVFKVAAQDLTNAEIITDIKATDMVSEQSYTVSSVNFTVDNNTVYVGTVCRGNITQSTAAGNTDYKFSMPGDGTSEYAHIITAINGEQVSSKVYSIISENENKLSESIKKMIVDNGQLYIGGLFYDILPYDKNKVSTRSTDLYVATLNKSDLSVKSVWNSNFDDQGEAEENANKTQEEFTTMLVADGTVYLNGYYEHTSTRSILGYLSYAITEKDNEQLTANVLITGSAVNGTSMVYSGITNRENTDAFISYYANSVSSINNAQKDIKTQSAFVNGNLIISQNADVTVYSLQGEMICTAQNSCKVNLNGIAAGAYVAKIITADGVSICKFIKK